MSDIVEEDHIIKDDSGHHANSRKGWNVKTMEVKYREILLLIPCLPTYPEGFGHACAVV